MRRASALLCCVIFAAVAHSGENAAPVDTSKLEIGWLTKDGAFPKDFSASASFPKITLDPVTVKSITVQDKKASIALSGRVDDSYESIVATPQLKEVRLLRDGKILGALPLAVVKDAPSELAPYARHFTFAGKIPIELDDKAVGLLLVTPPNALGLETKVEIAIEADKEKDFAPTGVEVKPSEQESQWSPFIILIRAPSGTDEKALYAVADWKHFGRKVTLMKRADQAEAEKTGKVDFVAAGADGKPLILAQPWDVRPPQLGFGNAMAQAERIYIGELDVVEKKAYGARKRKIQLRAVVHDSTQRAGIKETLKVVVKPNGLDWDSTFPDVPGDIAGEFVPRAQFGGEWDAIETQDYEGTLTLCEQQIPAANFGGIRK